ncbi:ABC transporter permease subunit [Mycoplasmopsis adleri]|uniref:ABC transporter permease subunit n=1 Tax=Mycoplasmopsis adleri TaxID=51362 RepID=UPI003873838B
MKNSTQKTSFGDKVRGFFMLDSTKKTSRGIFNSLWAVFFGLAISAIFIAISYQEDPFRYFWSLFDSGFSLNKTSLVYNFLIYGIASIGVGFAFRSGLFNIGVAGQMTFAGVASILIFGKYVGTTGTGGNDALGFGILLVAMLIGFAYSALAGILKAYFKIHEVVTTILLNWITVFIVQFFFNKFDLTSLSIAPNDSGRSAVFKFTGTLFNRDTFWIFALVFLFVLAAGTFIVLQFTSLGYKIKMNGLNKDASTYAGVNQKLTTIMVMGFSGALAGFAGFTYFLMFNQGTEGAKFTQPLLIGFDTIAISLLGMNSSIGILLSSIFYASLQNGAINIANVQYYTTSSIVEGGDKIIIGIILYVAALSNALSNFRPIEFCKKHIAMSSQKSYKLFAKNVYKARLAHIKREYKIAIGRAKALQQYNKDEYKKILKELKEYQNLIISITQYQSKIQNKKSFLYDAEKHELAKSNYEQIQKELSEINKELEKLGYFEVKKLQREKKYNIKISKVEYQYEITSKEFLDNIKAIDAAIKAGKDDTEEVKNLQLQKVNAYKELAENRDKAIADFSNEFDLKIAEAQEVINVNKENIVALLAKEKELKHELVKARKEYVESFDKLNAREIEELFNGLSKFNLQSKDKLDVLGYSQVQDVKLLTKANIAQAKINNKKHIQLAIARYDFLVKVISGLVKFNVSPSFLTSLEARLEVVKKDYDEQLEHKVLTQKEYDEKIKELEDDVQTFYSYATIRMMLNKRALEKANKQKDLDSIDKLKAEHASIAEEVKKEWTEMRHEYSNIHEPAKFDKFRNLYEKMLRIERGGQ